MTIGSTLGNYSIESELGRGGMGAVYIGIRRDAEGSMRAVAMQRAHRDLVADPDVRDAILRDARSASAVRHPNIVSVEDVEEIDGELLVVMDYVEGTSLSEVLAAVPVLAPGVAVRIVMDVCSALNAIHLAKTEEEIIRSPHLTVTVRAEGNEIKDARGWGNIVVNEAVDDTGHDLRIQKKPKLAKPPADEDDEDDQDANEGFTILEPLAGSIDRELLMDIGLASPARTATRIARLRGEFTLLRGGEIKEVAVDHLLDLAGKSIENPVLKEAGVEIVIVRSDKKDSSVLEVKVKGKPLAVSRMAIFEKDGKSASNASSYAALGGSVHEASGDFSLNHALTNRMVLKIQVIIGQEAVIVPFDLRDVILP